LPQNRAVKACSLSSRIAVWGAVAALLLKSAVPLLASAAAGLQGKGVAQICSIYGVDLGVAPASHLDSAGHGHHHHHAEARDGQPLGHEHEHDHGRGDGAHGSDHCALMALAAGVPEGASAWTLPSEAAADAPKRRCARSFFADDCASWVARLAHGPPTSA
jgi:hypothetical protein